MRNISKVAVVFGVLAATLAACDGGTKDPDPTPTPTASTTEPANIAEHESGPESPISYGLTVPKGATQVAPLQRTRSPRLLAEYRPALKAALAQKAAEEEAQAAEDLDNGITPTPSPTRPANRPNDDTFKLLETPPGPDTTASYMRIDGDPTDVVRRELAQIAALLPTAAINPNDLATICAERDGRIASCELNVRGQTVDEIKLRVRLTVDPGNVRTRFSPAASQTKPVMTLTVTHVGEPRLGQIQGEPDQVGDVANIDDTPETSGLIWPKMDLDAPGSEPVINDWIVPLYAELLLSGDRPEFAVLATDKASVADLVAKDFASKVSGGAKVKQDIVEDLNEVNTTYTAEADDGSIAQASFILSARGAYVLMTYTPPN